MARNYHVVAVVSLAALAALAGCGGFFSPAAQSEGTITPAPVPSQQPATTTTDQATAAATGTPDTVRATPSNVSDRYRSIRPTCTRPPSLVIHVQVSALANNDPATNEGINTTWQFASPTNRDLFRSYESFVETITTGYRPLLDAVTISYGPLERDSETAQRQVTVASDNGTATYRWQLERISDGEYEGCWMTVGVAEQSDDDGVVSRSAVSRATNRHR